MGSNHKIRLFITDKSDITAKTVVHYENIKLKINYLKHFLHLNDICDD